MADAKKTFEVIVTGNSEGASQSLASLEKIVSKFSDSTATTSKVVSAGLIAAGAATIKFGQDSVNAYVDAGKEVLALSRNTGLGAEEASKLRFAAEESGVSMDSLSVGVKKLSTAMVANNGEFDKLGVNVHDSQGRLRSVHDVLLDTADAFSKMANGAEKNDAANKLFGRSYQDLLPLLNKGKDIVELENEAQKYGLVLSADNVAAVKANIMAHREYDAALQGLHIRMGEEILPVQTAFVQTLTKIPGPIMDAVGPITALGAGLFSIVTPLASSASLIGPVVGKLKEISAVQKDGGTGALTMGQQATQGFAALGVAVGGATIAYGVWESAIKSAGKSFDESLAPAKTKASTASMDETVAMIARANDQINNMSQTVANSHAPWDADYRAEVSQGGAKLMDFAQQLQNNVDQAKALSAATGDSSDKTLAWVNAQQQAGVTFSSSDAQLQAYTGHIDASTLSSQDAAAAVKEQDQALKDLNDTLHASADPLFGELNAQKKLTDAQLASVKANQDQKKAQDEYTAAVKAHGPHSEAAKLAAYNLADAQNKAADADRNAAGAALDLQTNTDTLNEKLKTQPGLLDQAQQMLQTWTAQGWLTSQQAAAMQKQFNDTAYAATALGSYDPTVTITGDNSQALAAIGEVAAAMAKLKDSGDYRITGGPSGGHYASGTNALPDGSHLFNEAGAEIIEKHGSSVQIHNAGKTSQIMKGDASATPAAANGGGLTLIVQGSLVLEKDLMRIIDEAKRNGYRGPWASVDG